MLNLLLQGKCTVTQLIAKESFSHPEIREKLMKVSPLTPFDNPPKRRPSLALYYCGQNVILTMNNDDK